MTAALRFKLADDSAEFEAIHRLNYRTFVEEIPQHPPNEAKRLVDRFHAENTYAICLDGDELVWDRAFGRPRNSVVLPAGWTVVASSIPAVISQDPDGRQRLYFENSRNDDIQALIRARRASN